MRRLLISAILALVAFAADPMPEPSYKGENLVRPEGYREWMFVGANYGMGYTVSEEKTKRPGTFHNIYIQREAYQHYKRTGQFPDKTMLVMEVQRPGTNVSINKNGMFQDSLIGVEVALKDEKRFPERWAYFNFIGKDQKPLADAKAFQKDACWKCHNEHGAVDNVFVQFYPVLRDARR